MCQELCAYASTGALRPTGKKLASSVLGKAPPFEEWQPYRGFTTEPGYYYTTEDLKEIRDEYLRHKLVPRQSMVDFLHIKKLTINKVVIQRLSENWPEIKAFAAGLKMPWVGEGLPSVSQTALLHFLKPKREECRKHYEMLKEKQQGCAECGREDTLECDHIHPIATDPYDQDAFAFCFRALRQRLSSWRKLARLAADCRAA